MACRWLRRRRNSRAANAGGGVLKAIYSERQAARRESPADAQVLGIMSFQAQLLLCRTALEGRFDGLLKSARIMLRS
jgi:hypothetical protein